MPIDIKTTNQQSDVLIKDRLGVLMPFSRGIMATSILATGIETPIAYEVARKVQDALSELPSKETSSENLTALAVQVLEQHVNSVVAQRYHSWRKAKRIGRPIVISIVAASGVGKSTLATRLALRLGVNRVVTTDAIREVLRTVIPQTVLPELHVSSYESLPSQNTNKNVMDTFLRQSHAVAASSAAVAKRYIKEQKSLILEGVHLLPGVLTKSLSTMKENPVIVEVLISIKDENQHKSQLIHRLASEPGREGNRHLANFDTIRFLQRELQSLAIAANVPDLDLSNSADLTQQIVKRIIERTLAPT